MASATEFSQVFDDPSKRPHRFTAYKHRSDHLPSWLRTTETCLKTWRLVAGAVYDVAPTKFNGDGILRVLNAYGQQRLPITPAEDHEITRDPHITDITEVIALRLFATEMAPNARFPHPRVLHKDSRDRQHPGIDIIGYEELPGGAPLLLIVEVMASVERRHPPATVGQHRDQLIKETLDPVPPTRLLNELTYVHDECGNDDDKDILNGFIVALNAGLSRSQTRAVAILLRPLDMWDSSDWLPFYDQVDAFERATIPAVVWFAAIECDCSFSALIDRVKAAATPPVAGGGAAGCQ